MNSLKHNVDTDCIHNNIKASIDLYQNKLTRAEWETIEKPVSEEEKRILKLIVSGYFNTELKYNNSCTFLSYTKIENT